ncbi:MAG: CBS domain-containing protein [Propionibacterium sp.]|nr:CBS domain-containing protein [Propionibacterium sp.]
MQLQDIIRNKGTSVVTIPSIATVADLVTLMADEQIGAVVVSADGRHVEGIVSERDVVRGLAAEGADLLESTVADLMTAPVHTCNPGDSVEDTARTMTDRRIRHVPLVDADELQGIVSIGDVVKLRIDQLTDERDYLIDYVQDPSARR